METLKNLQTVIQDLIRQSGNHIKALREQRRIIDNQVQQALIPAFSSKKRLLEDVQSIEEKLTLVKIDLEDDVMILDEMTLSQFDGQGRNKRVEERLLKHIEYANQVIMTSSELIDQLGGDSASLAKPAPQNTDNDPDRDVESIGKTSTREEMPQEDSQEVAINFLDETREKTSNQEEVDIVFHDREDTTLASTETVEDYTQIIDNIDEEHVMFLVERGKNREKKGDILGYREAMVFYTDALSLVEGARNDLYKHIINEIESIYDKMVDLYEKIEDKAEIFFEKGEFLFQHRCYNKAIEIFEETSTIPGLREASKEMLRKCENLIIEDENEKR